MAVLNRSKFISLYLRHSKKILAFIVAGSDIAYVEQLCKVALVSLLPEVRLGPLCAAVGPGEPVGVGVPQRV